MICFLAIVSKFALIMWIAFMHRKRHASTMYYFAYCDGSMRHVASKDIVTKAMFIDYDSYVAYPVLHISKDTIYFKID